jgi:predicted GNAT family acetyltransferase
VAGTKRHYVIQDDRAHVQYGAGSKASGTRVEVRDNTQARRYEAIVHGQLAGFAVYRRPPRLITFVSEAMVDDRLAGVSAYERPPGLIAIVHTEVFEAFSGSGVGAALVAGALDDARRQGLAVLPLCPFVSAYIRKHRAYLDVVPPSRREAFQLG